MLLALGRHATQREFVRNINKSEVAGSNISRPGTKFKLIYSNQNEILIMTFKRNSITSPKNFKRFYNINPIFSNHFSHHLERETRNYFTMILLFYKKHVLKLFFIYYYSINNTTDVIALLCFTIFIIGMFNNDLDVLIKLILFHRAFLWHIRDFFSIRDCQSQYQ